MKKRDFKGRIICAGIPRCGTTMMFRALAGLPPGGTTPRLKDAAIVKSHSFKPSRFKGCDRALFLFGDPVSAIVSTRLKRYQQSHFDHCGASHISPEEADIYREDCLNYERMFDAWMRPQEFDLICIRFEKIYANLEIISSFAGRHVYFPPWRARATDLSAVDPDDIGVIKATYAGLIEKVSHAPDIQIFRRNNGLGHTGAAG